jgi:ParB family chromosome partitioning protein
MTTSATAVQPEYVTLPVDRIRESTTNPRQRFDALEELAASIRTHGVLQPILERPLRKDFELVVRAQRLHAARLAGLSSVPRAGQAARRSQRHEKCRSSSLQRQDVRLEEVGIVRSGRFSKRLIYRLLAAIRTAFGTHSQSRYF